MTEMLFQMGITTCELCNHPAYKRDEDLGYLLCKRCFAEYNPAIQAIELNEVW